MKRHLVYRITLVSYPFHYMTCIKLCVCVFLQAVLEEMMVEQTDLVRLRMVRMSNVPDTLYMVNNAVPQCCHMINHQQMAGSQTAPPSVVANEIPGGLSAHSCLVMMHCFSQSTISVPSLCLLYICNTRLYLIKLITHKHYNQVILERYFTEANYIVLI